MQRFAVGLFCSLLLGACGSSSSANDGGLFDGDGSPIADDGALIVPDADPNAPDALPSAFDAGLNAGCDPAGAECNNCIDDDNDGRIDGFDPECTGEADNSEASFATDIPGDNVSNSGVQDCFFDGNSGGGNDGCHILDCCFEDPRTCTPEEEANVGTSSGNPGCVGSQECIDNCGDLAPPGCDCFGCCTVCDPENPTDCRDIYLPTDVNSPCTADNLDACTLCTLNDSCGNGGCDNANCELCPGQTIDDLPPECNEQSCPNGATTCTANADCTENEYCSNGCCVGSIIID
tara:strand:- start:27430 stop:28302 length:873 start_codon:yes stop_codon:yes gene_type:complete